MRLFNSACIDVFGGLVRRGAGLRAVRLTVRYGLIDLGENGLCLVDTGIGPQATAEPRTIGLRIYNSVLGPALIADQSPEAVLRKLGATTADVRLVVVTHFHADHISGLRAFPRARIVTSGAAARRVMAMSPAAALRHGIFKELVPADLKDRIMPLEDMKREPTGTVLGEGYDLFGDVSYLAIPLPGHAFGHFGLFWQDEAGPAVYATDAAWTSEALLRGETPWISSAVVFDDRDAGKKTQAMLQEFHRESGRILLCHDVEDPPS
jgi:glyoxylase-like metal-dependent hydrolase (beta-lactamase superfamily II)